MERLTARDKNGEAYPIGGALSYQMIDKLCAYEDAEEQGLLIKLPCKVGDTVWAIIKSFTYGEIGDRPEAWYRVDKREFDYDMIPKYGKTVFLTREEAESALKGESNDV